MAGGWVGETGSNRPPAEGRAAEAPNKASLLTGSEQGAVSPPSRSRKRAGSTTNRVSNSARRAYGLHEPISSYPGAAEQSGSVARRPDNRLRFDCYSPVIYLLFGACRKPRKPYPIKDRRLLLRKFDSVIYLFSGPNSPGFYGIITVVAGCTTGS
jgi:hypothetical protein